MLLEITQAHRFEKGLSSGRTGPALVTAETASGTDIEIVVKFMASFDMGATSAAAEALAAMLAIDLGLPVPQPFLVEITAEFAESISEAKYRAKAQASVGMNFGTRKLPPGYYPWPRGKALPEGARQTAVEVLAFDTLIVNSDRRPQNPNFLANGREIFIFDHELALFTRGLIGWKPPWEPLAVQFPILLNPDSVHVFASEFKGKEVSLDRLQGAFEAVTPQRLAEYRSSIPTNWLNEDVDQMLRYIGQLRSNLPRAIQNIKEALL